jgi:hypothetical protein
MMFQAEDRIGDFQSASESSQAAAGAGLVD